jgi:threonine aldolase
MRIDLRSDTLSLPSAGMRRAIAEATVGDDLYGEDPTVAALEERMAALLGKGSGLFVPSGTMANQIAVRLLTRPGDVVLIGAKSHLLLYEAGAAAAAGVQLESLGSNGLFTAEDVELAFRAEGNLLEPPTTLVTVENTHNVSGGIVWPPEELAEVCRTADDLGMATLLDGARLFNAAVAVDRPVADLAAPFQMVTVALSKGLGCPVGSIIAGSAADIAVGRRYRKMLGGAMRQSGFLAAAGLYALEHNLQRLADDHANARLLASKIADAPLARIDLGRVQTNIVMFDVTGSLDAKIVVERAQERGVLVSEFGPRTVRAVTYLGIEAEDCRAAGTILAELLS